MYKVFVFDLDNTLYFHHDEYVDYHKNVKEFLKKLKDNDKILCIATHNNNPSKYLNIINIKELFDYIIFEKKNMIYGEHISLYTGKDEMILDIINKTGYEKEDVVFFDDNNFNIDKVENFGVKSIKVDDKFGLNFDDIIKTFC